MALVRATHPLHSLSTFYETLHGATGVLRLTSPPPEDMGLSSFLR